MKAVNLIPPEDRRGESAPSRTGGMAYVVVGVLAIVLAAVTGTVMLDKRVADREAEAVRLEAQAAEAQASADALSSYVTFQGIRDARVATIDSLAKSRFDWERVMRELAIVIPEHVWLTGLTGTVAPGINVQSAPEVALRDTVPGPAIEIVGCGRSQRDVARFVAALGDIDGVTRVTAAESEKPDSDSSSAGAADSITDECRTRNSVPKFQIVAAFDSVVAPVASAPTAPTPPPVEGESAPVAADGGVAAAEDQRSASQDEIAAAEGESENATNLVPGG